MRIGVNRRNRVVSQAVLESLETRTLLTNTAPVLDAIPAITMLAPTATTQLPKTIQVPLTASDANGDALTYTVTSSNPDIVPITHAGDPFLKMTVQIGADVSEVQTLTPAVGASAGTYTLSFGGNTTTPLAFNATTADVQAALRLLTGLSGVVVSGSPLTSTAGMVFTFPLASGDVNLITIDATALQTSTGVTVTETTPGSVSDGVDEVQTMTGSHVAAGGTYTLSFGGNTTGALNFDATAADVQAALRLLAGAENVIVSGSPLTSTAGMTFTFPAASGNFSLVTIDATNLTSSVSCTVTETIKGQAAVVGDMWLLLYKEWAPTTIQTITGFLDAGFYNNLTFHRILKGFMAQGGDPLGTGTGGPGFQFKDEFNQNLIFSNRGQLAMANSGDDTNGSQFFITDVATSWLDFNHTIWGQLVRGFDTLDHIVNSPVSDATSSAPAPAGSVKILSASIVADPTDTAITLSARKAGISTITVTVNDGHGGTSVKTFQVTADAHAPVAVDDSYTTPLNTALVVAAPGILANDTDADHEPLTATVLSQPAHGTLSLNANGSFTYTPTTGFSGADSFTYTASDGMLTSNTATVNISVRSSSSPILLAVADSYSMLMNTSLVVVSPGVLANDTNANSNPLAAVLQTQPSHGTLTLNANGSFTYTPATGYTGADSFSYVA